MRLVIVGGTTYENVDVAAGGLAPAHGVSDANRNDWAEHTCAPAEATHDFNKEFRI